ncbi:hypothetical protein [Psychrobacillus psychrotolerans]|uniref:hypothetical protein n=1 Tax=Psychrobacillus psychrotolerans TaxID=126156 RepID=UPI003B027B12
MSIFKKVNLKGFLWIFIMALFGVSFITHTHSYFNTKEINLLITSCYENDGEVKLEIHNNLTSSYSFECKPK